MRRPQEIAKDVATMSTMVNLTSVFESLASMRISQIKGKVQQSEKFFGELWNIYHQIRVDDTFRFGRAEQKKAHKKELRIAITAEGGFSGDIDQRLIRLMLEGYDKNLHDIIIIGHHGAVQLAQQGIEFKKYFKLPKQDEDINVEPITEEATQYDNTIAYYQSYQSLSVQNVKKMNLSKAVKEQGEASVEQIVNDEIISEQTYIFEPSTYEVVEHLERSMTSIILAQIVLESKLAQYASRFKAMTAAHERADDSLAEFRMMYNRSKRAIKDARLKEIVIGMRKVKAAREAKVEA
ncbi:F0F1 ATP synthase subunit gamma [Candidatus Saccharibacteria bacterium]|nr:F0F1 ATP synthase subunit gamma [Candidatus Saccharibacteria bacterium]